MNNDNRIPNKKYVDDKIPNLDNYYTKPETNSLLNKKQDKEVWKTIGKSISNRKYGDFNLDFNKLYRIIITWEDPPFNSVNLKFKIEFKTGGSLGGHGDVIIFLTKGKIKDKDVELNLKLNGAYGEINMIGGNETSENIYLLEELQDTIKIDINTQLKINSKSLKVNKLSENTFDIELKSNPTPCPCPKWKDVAFANDTGYQINYELKNNTYYKIFYVW